LHSKLEIAEECQDVYTEWQQIKDSLLNATIEVTQNKNKKPRNEWWDDECRKAMEEKNLARMKCINTWSVQKVSDLNFSHINQSSLASVHHCRCGGDICAHV
jgi:hypothetical protein